VSEKHSAYARSLAPKSCPYSGQLAHSQRNFYSSPFAPPHGQACVAHIRRKTQPVAPPPSPPTTGPFPAPSVSGIKRNISPRFPCNFLRIFEDFSSDRVSFSLFRSPFVFYLFATCFIGLAVNVSDDTNMRCRHDALILLTRGTVHAEKLQFRRNPTSS
jgi:hypothetical protein